MSTLAILLIALHSTFFISGDNTADIQQLKSNFLLLLNNYKTIDTKYNALQSKYNVLEKSQKLKSSYCELKARGKCGDCVCKDDFNIPKKYYCDCRNLQPQRDCLAHRQNGVSIDGYYTVTMNGYRTTQVYCDQTTSGGGWTVIQRRMDGSANFYRTWEQYKVTFLFINLPSWLFGLAFNLVSRFSQCFTNLTRISRINGHYNVLI